MLLRLYLFWEIFVYFIQLYEFPDLSCLHIVLLVGTGYLTACLAIMVGPQGRAVGVEHIPELVEFSIKSIEKSAAAPLLKEGSLSIHAAGMS